MCVANPDTIWNTSNTIDVPGSEVIVFNICVIATTWSMIKITMFRGLRHCFDHGFKFHWHPAAVTVYGIQAKSQRWYLNERGVRTRIPIT